MNRRLLSFVFAACSSMLAQPASALWSGTYHKDVLRNDGHNHGDLAVTINTFPDTAISFLLVPCPANAYAGVDGDRNSPSYGKVIHVSAPVVAFKPGTKAELGPDKVPAGTNGVFRYISAKEAVGACGTFTNHSEEGWAWLIAKRKGWKALQVQYTNKDRHRVDWSNGGEQIAAVLKVESEDGGYEAEVKQDLTQQVHGNCPASEMLRFRHEQLGLRLNSQSIISYDRMSAYYDDLMQLSGEALVLRQRGLDGGCSPDQIIELNDVQGVILASARGALRWMIARDNANAEALEVIFNTLLETERCMVRGTIKTFAKILQTFPPSAAAFEVGNVAMANLHPEGLTLMEFGVKWGDVAVLHLANGGRETEGCAAKVIGGLCRIAADALWNRAGLKVIDQKASTASFLDHVNVSLWPKRAAPPNRAYATKIAGQKGWHGLQGISKVEDWCYGFRQVYFSTFASVYKEFDKVDEACLGAQTEIPEAFSALKYFAVHCSGLQNTWKRFSPPPPSGGSPPPPPGGSPPPPPGGYPPPSGGSPPPPAGSGGRR